jgi:hypothetical protein
MYKGVVGLPKNLTDDGQAIRTNFRQNLHGRNHQRRFWICRITRS